MACTFEFVAAEAGIGHLRTDNMVVVHVNFASISESRCVPPLMEHVKKGKGRLADFDCAYLITLCDSSCSMFAQLISFNDSSCGMLSDCQCRSRIDETVSCLTDCDQWSQ